MDFEEMKKKRMDALRTEFDQLPSLYSEQEIRREEVMVPMRDGIRLKTYIVKPAALKHTPVLFKRSCYPHGFEVDMFAATQWAMKGFPMVFQYCRGTGGSEGIWEPNVNERPDGIDAIHWLADEPWVESIGYFGDSYLALTGWAMIDSLPQKVKGMYLCVYGTNRFVSAYNDGLFRQDILTVWAMGNAGVPIHSDRLESCKYMPQIRVDEELWGVCLPWYKDLISNTNFSDDYWQTGFWHTLRSLPEKVNIPIVFEEGWYDHHLGSALDGYRRMKGDGLEKCLFRVGAWKHGKEPALDGHDCRELHNDQVLSIYAFFDKLLRKMEPTPSGVSLYVIGEDRWIHTPSWPLPTQIRPFYLDAAARTLYENTESEQNAAPSPAVVSYIYDPANPLMSHGAESCFATFLAIGSKKQPEPNFRSDVISFISPPLTEDVTIIGKINADLYVSSDAEDTAFSMKIMEVFENGDTYNIRSGITTLAYRGHTDYRQTYTPGNIVKINIDTWDIAWTIKQGSRLRIDISSSDFPQYNIHSNYPGVWSLQDKCKKATQCIYSGESYPSAVFIPVVNASAKK